MSGSDADENFLGTRIFWSQKQKGLVWFNDQSYEAEVNNWHLAETTECPGTIIFPTCSFTQVTEIPNARFNNISGLAIFPCDKSIRIKSKSIVLKTMEGVSIEGIGFDLNDDKIYDVFIYDEDIDESAGYTRLYLNVDGKWKCTWVSLNQVCI